MEKLARLEEQVELIKQDLKENAASEWQKSRIQRERERESRGKIKQI